MERVGLDRVHRGREPLAAGAAGHRVAVGDFRFVLGREVPRERGLSYVRGSHNWGLVHRITNFSGGDHSDKNTYGDAGLDVGHRRERGAAGEYELLSWDMAPGDILLFYSAMMHGAPGIPSGSSHRRRGYATRWCGDDVTFRDKPGTMHQGWKRAGFDNGLNDGDPIACALHPDCC